jgi:hypothetical protein
MAGPATPRYVIGAAFAAGVATTAAFVALTTGRVPTSQSTPRAESASTPSQVASRPPPVRSPEVAPAPNGQAQVSTDSWVDPVKGNTAKQPSHPPLNSLEFHLKDAPEEHGDGVDRGRRSVAIPARTVATRSEPSVADDRARATVKPAARPERIKVEREKPSELAAPLPPRRPEAVRVATKLDEHGTRTLVADRRARRVLVPNQPNASARKQPPTPVRVRYAETNEYAPVTEVREPRQRVTSAPSDGVMRWLMDPSDF